MKFCDYRYERPNLEAFMAEAEAILSAMASAASFEDVVAAVERHEKLARGIASMNTLAEIRFTVDTSDEFYKAEKDYFDEVMPVMGEVEARFSKAVAESPFRAELIEKYGKQMMSNAETTVKRMKPELVPLMQEQNRLASRYTALTASLAIPFNGEICNNYGLLKYMESPDRAVRKAAFEAWAGWFAENEKELGEIYDALVKLRNEMGALMGFETFTPLGYLNMGRTDYGPEEVARFRDQVVKTIVPACVELRARQAKRIGVDKLRYYDEAFMFPGGNADPIGDRDYLVGSAKQMYRELSAETGEFFDFMVDHELLDLETKPNKAVGGYCTYISDYSSPFIFSNFNGTAADVGVLTHEAGHAFEGFCAARNVKLFEYGWSTSEVNEIHSMSMEYFTYPWMELFFGEKADRSRYIHLVEALTFIPYGCCVDEFQHIIYEKPELTPDERTAVWKELEKKYMPDRDYDGVDVMERGGFWMQKLHIFLDPFYYIDYTLASMGAFEFFVRMQADSRDAWADYLKLCCAGGSLPYLELLELAKLSNPFGEGTVEKVVKPIVDKLFAADDKAM